MNKVICASILLSIMAYSYNAAKADAGEDGQTCTVELGNLEVTYICSDNPYLYTTNSNCSGVTQFGNSWIGWDVACKDGHRHIGHLDLEAGQGTSDNIKLRVKVFGQ